MLGPLLAMPSGQGLNMTLLAILKVNRANWLLVLEKNWSCGKMFLLLTRYHYWSDNINIPLNILLVSHQYPKILPIIIHYLHFPSYIQWPFQEPKLEVPTICKAYVRGYTSKIWPRIWYSTSILGSWNAQWYIPIINHHNMLYPSLFQCSKPQEVPFGWSKPHDRGDEEAGQWWCKWCWDRRILWIVGI